jgi:hypothetical protein
MSSPEDVRELFAQYADAYARGERPRAADYLERAGEDADLLAAMLERFLGAARTLPATTEERERLAALLGTPLLERRKRRRLRIDEVVDSLMDTLAIRAGKRGKLRLYYQRLENGTLDPAGVSEQVWNALEKVFGTGKLVPAPPPRGLRFDAEVAYYRVDASTAAASPPLPAGAHDSPDVDERDEVDELFLGSLRD